MTQLSAIEVKDKERGSINGPDFFQDEFFF